ncbi:MAG TPA: DASS family sodium-coupled anion symporter [Pyrinomonadaceae bacterium]|nr:DASS family sodium-coupled anion symporter [Pyrinomonadaceae bacterium]HMP65418.1 DASS family sodium-coupled anion symporter [Pyrinomonadaceae bacterium]
MADDPVGPRRKVLWRWLLTLMIGFGIALIPPPEAISREAWTLFAIFIATIVGSIVQPLTGAAMVLLGVIATAVFGALTPTEALKGYSEPVVWLVLAAFFLSVGMIKTGLGRRTALHFVRLLGGRTVGLGYALIATDFVLASVIPSNSARNGGVILPIARSICETYDSRPYDGTARRLGTYLMTLLYQADVIICATFITGQASNIIIADLVQKNTDIQIGYLTWFAAAIVPALVSLVAVPYLIFRLSPPEVKETPAAAQFATGELEKLGPMKRQEWLMFCVLVSVVVFWTTKDHLHSVDTAIVAMSGICALLVTRVIDWRDLMGEQAAWSVFVWYGGLVNMAAALSNTGLTQLFAGFVGGQTSGFGWVAALALIALVYFYTHYLFASITAHVLAMFVPFLAVTLVAGAPAGLAVLLLAHFSNLNAGLTHYGTTPAPIYFGTGYVTLRQWWIVGFAASVVNILIWAVIGAAWWKLLGWW